MNPETAVTCNHGYFNQEFFCSDIGLMCTICPLEFERGAEGCSPLNGKDLCVVTFLTSGTTAITCVCVVALLVKEWGVHTQVE